MSKQKGRPVVDDVDISHSFRFAFPFPEPPPMTFRSAVTPTLRHSWTVLSVRPARIVTKRRYKFIVICQWTIPLQRLWNELGVHRLLGHTYFSLWWCPGLEHRSVRIHPRTSHFLCSGFHSLPGRRNKYLSRTAKAKIWHAVGTHQRLGARGNASCRCSAVLCPLSSWNSCSEQTSVNK